MDETKLYEGFGHLVRTQREKRGLTQQQFADAVKLSRTSISNIESGRQRVLLHQVFEFADVLDIAAQVLLPKQDDCRVSALDIDNKDYVNLSKHEKEFVQRFLQTRVG